jgi:nucleoside-diphosphate kinase
MATSERTLTIVKPDGVSKRVVGDVLRRFEDSGLRILALKMLSLSPDEAGRFYKVHRDKPFYASLKEYMSSGPVVVVVLEAENAIYRTREIMGATNPAEAAPGTIRADHAESIERNIVHGSDSPESAAYEIPYFFSEVEIKGS